jgi:signal transduction histidine kinase
MSQPGGSDEQARWTAEVLRRASAVLSGRMVGVWEVSPTEGLVPLAFNTTETLAWDATAGVREALRHIAMPAHPGSRWVAGRVAEGERWCVAPVRTSVPAPPPGAVERRSRERLALELAGLCLGLSGQLAAPSVAEMAESDLFRRFTQQLGTFAQEIGDPVAAARSAVARGSAALAAGAVDGEARDRLLEDLRAASRTLEQAVSLVRTVQERARAVLSQGGHFDVVQVVWSCVDDERAQAGVHGATLELKTLAYVVSIPGNREEFQAAVGALLRLAVQSLMGRAATVRVALENVGPVVRLTIKAPGADLSAPETATLSSARRIVAGAFGGTITASYTGGEGLSLVLTVPAPSHRFRDPALWWES